MAQSDPEPGAASKEAPASGDGTVRFLGDESLAGAAEGGAALAAREGVVEIRDMDVAYGDVTVLKDITCRFPEHTVTAIMGPSGCGKTTLVKTVNRTLELVPEARILSGRILFRGRDLYGDSLGPMAVRKRIGIIHQRPTPFPMSVLQNVLFGATFHRHTSRASEVEYASHYLDLVGLLDEVKDRFGESAMNLSGGQQQRLCLARTLANQPEIIIMDEPCSSLDHAASQRIEELIRELKRTYTFIIVTHNMSQARRVSDLSLFLFEGRIVEAGTTEQMFTRPRSELTRAFVSGMIG